MSLELYESLLRKNVTKRFENYKAIDILRLEKNRMKVNSMTDVLKLGLSIDFCDAWNSAVKVFGLILEDTLNDYAKAKGATMYTNKVYMDLKFDSVFRVGTKVFVLESKACINLDTEKTKITKKVIDNKKEVTNSGINESYEVISKVVVWSKASCKEAIKVAKGQLKDTEILLGVEDFFSIFGETVSMDEFSPMIQDIWWNTITPHFPKKTHYIHNIKHITSKKVLVGGKIYPTLGDCL